MMRRDELHEDAEAASDEPTRRRVLSRGAMLAAFVTLPALAACNGAEDAAEDAADDAGDAVEEAGDAVEDAADDAADAATDAAN